MDIATKGGKEFSSHFVFVQTNTVEDLKNRLQARGTETEDTLNRRVANADKEMKTAKECGLFKKFLINDDRERFIQEAEQYVT